MTWTSKSFELSNFLAPQPHVQIMRVVETKRHFSRETNHHIVACCHIKLGATVLVESHHFSLLPSHLPFPLLFTACCTISTPCSMADVGVHDPAPLIAPSINDEDSGNDSRAESAAMATSSSLTRGVVKMANGEIPELMNFFKKMTITEDGRKAYHDHGWLVGNLLSFIPEVDVPPLRALPFSALNLSWLLG
jgi:hypothetical protein